MTHLPLALTVVLSMALAIAMGYPFIDYLRRWKVGQSIREEGPQSHHAKAGTPTMGGWIIVLPAIVTAILVEAVQGSVPPDLLAVIGVILGCGFFGWLDDYLIIKRKSNKGLTARQKMGGVILVGVLFAVYLALTGHGTSLVLPISHASWDLGFAYYPLLVLVIAATTNAVNLTDGLDGLAAGTSAIAFAGLAFMLSQYATFASLGSITVLLLALIGGCLGFLWFNSHPAQVFMGDTGSLALGGAVAACAAMGRLELFLIPIGALFVAETLSVILQVASFKTTGKRIFKMSPLHHHFELSGWKETKVVQRFYLIGLLAAILTIALL
ncbi:MAG TPA: phospho-N-acetylmuramoyl-pentapeptide-transferase [Stenomitos sp.]